MESQDMRDASAWPALSRPILLENMRISDAIHAVGTLSTTADATPSGQNVGGQTMQAFPRRVASLGDVTFDQVIQFGPNGEARVGFDQPARHIRLGIAPVANGTELPANAFLLRVSGVNGSVAVLRDNAIAR
jgi:hypothetical protein